MTGERIIRSSVMGATLALAVVGCPPVPPDDSDGGVGGSATGGSGTGGAAGSAVSVCAAVASLPAMGTACSTMGESQCDPSGNRCVCERNIWYCNAICATTYPTEPAPNSACVTGAACNYPSGVGCQCFGSRWACVGTSSCPAIQPITGDACNGLAGVWCDYPNQNLASHYICACTANADASTGATWTCIQSRQCPATQPTYDTDCEGIALCSYGSTRCKCWAVGTPWVCGFGSFYFGFSSPPCPGCE